MDGLAALIQNQLGHAPFSGAVFVFRAKRADRVKLIVWDGSGLIMAYKRLEHGKFAWPAIPDDPQALKALLLAERVRNNALRQAVAAREAQNHRLAQTAAADKDRAERLERLLAELRRTLYGQRSEKLDPHQLELAFEDLESGIAALDAENDKAEPAHPHTKARPRRNRGALPGHLPRIEHVIEPENTTCGCELHQIGEDRSERLDVIPARFRVIVTVRPKYACRSCADGVRQAPAPEHVIERGLPTEGLLAHVLIGKYADHLPLYRQAEMCRRQGIELDRSTLAHWVG